MHSENVDYTKVALENKQLFDENDNNELPVKDIGENDEEEDADEPKEDDEDMEEIFLIKFKMKYCLKSKKNLLQ